jgi:hypothetical protein
MSQRYVYYRVAEADLAGAVAAIGAMQQRLLIAHPGLEADRLRRPGAADGLVTLMEIYRAAGGLSDAMGRAIEAEAAATLSHWLVGSRHIENFEPL